MQEFPSATLTRDPVSLKDAARKNPVTITEHKRPRFVLMSYEAYLTLTEERKNPRQAIRASDAPDELKALVLEAIDQPYDP